MQTDSQIPVRSSDLVRRLESDNARLRAGLKAVEDLMSDSYGVAGLHLNGDIAPWKELRKGGRFEEWLLAFDAALSPNDQADSVQIRKKRDRRVTHKTCPTWGVTQCMKTLWPNKIDAAPKTTVRWRDVTCKKCLKDRPAPTKR